MATLINGSLDDTPVPVSDVAKRSNNPIRRILESLKRPELPDKPFIALSLGDPCVFGNLAAPSVLIETMIESLRCMKNNGYIHSAGSVEARAAVATWVATATSPLTADDVIIASGCSGALDLAITVLLNPGDSLLVPKPAFPLYQTLAHSKGISVKHYRLLPEKQWEVDLEHLESLIDGSTKAILVNNPSNPCGSVYSESHLRAILDIAKRHRLPIIADEIYGNLVFQGSPFFPMASLTSDVPVLCAGGIAKEFLVPGWRVGWVCVHDRGGRLADVRRGLYALSQLVLGANSLVLSALPSILSPVPGSEAARSLAAFHVSTLAILQCNALALSRRLAAVPGLHVVMPQGAMYLMLGFTPTAVIPSDVEFSQLLLAEENVCVLPGTAFNIVNFVRIVFCAPEHILLEAADRIAAFVQRHF